MNIVAVKYPCGGKKEYWFEVPAEIVAQTKKGSTVVCDTIHGRELGVVTSDVISGENIDQLAVRLGASLPLKKIVCVTILMPMDKIKIQKKFTKTSPSLDKINNRIRELYDYGAFKTNVVVDQNGTLLNGYTAYLVSKMFDLKYIRVIVSAS